MPIVDLFPPGPIANGAHADALLELAYLMTAADGRFADEERRAFTQLVTRVLGTPASEADIDALVQRFVRAAGGQAAADRVRQLGPTLPEDLRESAWKITIGIALADNDASPREDALMNVLFEALGLDPSRAEALAAEARGLGAG